MEIWKDITGYEGIYQVSNLGRVKRIGKYRNQYKEWNSNVLLKPIDNSNGYLFVTLSKNNKTKQFYIHRLVAYAFIENTDKLPEVNHKDGNKQNNQIENLEWVTCSENIKHCNKHLNPKRKNCKGSKPVIQLDLNGNFIKEYPSYREAVRQTGISKIDKVCNRIKYRKTAGGYMWKYK